MLPLQRHLKNVVHNYTEAERQVREATSNDPWGPSSTLMSDIADRTYNVISFTEIMQMIWKRLNDKTKNWRHVYKSLTLLEYIIKTGSEKVALQCREHIHAIETLVDFHHVEDNQDVGNRVREKARMLNALLLDEKRLQEERTKALLARERLMLGGAGGGSQLGGASGGGGSYSSFSPQPLGNVGSSSIDNRRPSSQPSLIGLPSQNPIYRLSIPTSKKEEKMQLKLALQLSTHKEKGIGSVENDSMTCGTGDFDSALPGSYGEEQLQLQLALAMSKEEHEREVQRRREEEAKEALKLQMVLEQSKRDEQHRSVGALIVPSTAAPASNTSGGGGSLFNLIDTSLSAAPANLPDPWSTITPISSHPRPAVQSTALIPPPPLSEMSYSTFSATNFNGNNNNSARSGELSILDDAWVPKDPAPTRPIADGNPWATLDPLTAPILSTSLDPYTNSNGQYQMNNNTINTNQSIGTIDPGTTKKRTPADFLGDHKDLVDLEKLVDRNPSSTNPFATSTRSHAVSSTNPFNANLPPKPSLNQLTSSVISPPMLALPSNTSVFQPPSAFAFPAPRQPFAAATSHGDPFNQPPPQTSQPQQPQPSLNPFF